VEYNNLSRPIYRRSVEKTAREMFERASKTEDDITELYDEDEYVWVHDTGGGTGG